MQPTNRCQPSPQLRFSNPASWPDPPSFPPQHRSLFDIRPSPASQSASLRLPIQLKNILLQSAVSLLSSRQGGNYHSGSTECRHSICRFLLGVSTSCITISIGSRLTFAVPDSGWRWNPGQDKGRQFTNH